MPAIERCPCGADNAYGACCEPYHRGVREAAGAETLMRSRFSAFAKREIDYLFRTLHSEHEDRRRPRDEVIRELQASVRNYRYMGLTIADRDGPDAEGIARVLFVARIFEKGRDRSFAEASTFAQEDGAWKYLDGVGLPLFKLPFDPTTVRIDEFVARVRAIE
jgi:SEC-C motif-containing protein